MNIKKWRNISIIFSIVAGVILHFLYEWSGKNAIVGAFSAVNESTWEHLKLAFFPMLVIAIIGYFLFGKDVPNYIKGKSVGIIVAVSFITVFFYTYSGIIGENFSIVNIISFVVAIILGEMCAYKIITDGSSSNEELYLRIVGLLLICFIVFTYFTPRINFFKDPVTGKYGINVKG